MYLHLYGQHVSPNFYLFSLRQMQISNWFPHIYSWLLQFILQMGLGNYWKYKPDHVTLLLKLFKNFTLWNSQSENKIINIT